MAISAAISPNRGTRDEARRLIGHFVEVHVRCPIPELVRRNVKGLYAKALRGEIAHFTGVSDPCEEPERPNVVVDSSQQTREESRGRILAHLESRRFIPCAGPVPAGAPRVQ